MPYEALTGFFDPSVQFGLKFEVQETIEEGANDTEPTPIAPVAKITPAKAEKTRSSGTTEASEPKPKPAKPKVAEKPAVEEPAPAGDAKVVSIDAFRKKT